MTPARDRVRSVAFLALFFLAAVGSIGFLWWMNPASQSPEILLSVRQIRPEPKSADASLTTFLKPGEACEFTFELTNRGRLPLDGLRIGASCQCQVAAAPSPSLNAGETTHVSLKLQAPRVGESRTRIPIFVDGRNAPIAAIEVVIQVEVQPPILFGTPADLKLETVAGVPLARDFFVETVERADSVSWIQGLEFAPTDLVSWRLAECREKSMAGAGSIRRVYRFELNVPTETKTSRGTYRLCYSHTTDLDTQTRAVTLTVHDPISVFPNPITLSANQATPVVVVIRSDDYRVELGEVSPGLSATPSSAVSSGNTLRFHLQSTEAPDINHSGIVQLLCRKGSDVERREIPVQFITHHDSP